MDERVGGRVGGWTGSGWVDGRVVGGWTGGGWVGELGGGRVVSWADCLTEARV